MDTEDDTFNRLRRPPVRVMYRLWMDCPIMDWESKEAFDFFETHGWTRDIFHDAWETHIGERGEVSDD